MTQIHLSSETYPKDSHCQLRTSPIASQLFGDKKLEQTINLSPKRNDGVIGHANQNQYVAHWDLIYHEMNAVKNVQYDEYTGVNENMSEAWNHHESSQSTMDRKEGHIQ